MVNSACLLEVAPYPFNDFGGWKCSTELVDHAVVLESNDSRDRADTETSGKRLMLFGIDFDELRFEGKGAGRLFEGWGHRAARTAPRRPEIGDDQPSVIDHEAIESFRVDCQRLRIEQ